MLIDMNDYSNIKTGHFKHEPLPLAMASVPVFSSRAMSGATNIFQNPPVPSTYGFTMDSTLGHTPALYNHPSSHLPNTSKMSSRPPEVESHQMNHGFPKPPAPVLYHNFTPLSSCNIVTTNNFFNLNAPPPPDMPKHSYEEVLNLPPAFNADSTMNAQMMLPKPQYHEHVSSVASENRHYFQDSLNSFVQTLNTIPHDIQMAESKKQSRNHKIETKFTDVTQTEGINVISNIKNHSPITKDMDTKHFVDNSVDNLSADNTVYSCKDVYKCGFCEFKFSTNELLVNHLNTHRNVLAYQCGLCGAAFADSSQLVKHVQLSHDMKPPYACGFCSSTFYRNEELMEHIGSHEKQQSIEKSKLPSISLVTEKIKALERRDESLQNEDTELEEDGGECETENCDPSQLNLNSATNTIVIGKDTDFSLRKGPSKIVMNDVDLSSVCTVIVEPSSAGGVRKKHLFKCNFCEKVCKDKGSLVSHVRTHTKGRPYECKICLAKFKQYAHLSDHVMTKHTKDRPFICDRCAKTFNRKSHLQDHIRLRHTEDKLYHCPDCNATFQKRTEFSEHKKSHGKPPKYQCNMCPRQFRNVTDYERHIRSHTKEKRFECEVCHLTFGLLANAKKHMIKHSEDRPFKCEVCPKAYHFEHDYKRHKLTHLNKKPFPCSDCYKSFKNASLLKKHAKEAHLKSEEDALKKPFKCLTCRKRFRIQWDLDRHRKIHAKKKAFPCRYCYKSYGSEAMLAKHCRIHDGQDLPLYDHSKDLIDESQSNASKKKRGRKPKLRNETEDKVTEEDTDSNVGEKAKCRGRPPRQKKQVEADRASVLKCIRQSTRRKNYLETDDESTHRIKVTLRRKKLHKRMFHCPDCNKPFLNEAMLKKHSKVHQDEDDDETEDDSQQSAYQSESTNDAVGLKSSLENASSTTSLNESSAGSTCSRRGIETHGNSSLEEDTTQGDEFIVNNSSESECGRNSSSMNKKTVCKRKIGMPLFSS